MERTFYIFKLLEDLPGTVLGEGTVDDVPINLGEGPQPVLEDLFEMVCNLMTQ
jgi:hypothetical protein